MPIDPRDVFPAHLGEIRDIARIAGGLSGADVYAVATATGKFVLRMQGDDRGAWSRATALQRLASDAGIAPELVAVDERSATSISVLIEGMPFAAVAGHPEHRSAVFASLVEVLGRLHAIPLDPEAAPQEDMLATARAIWTEQSRRPGFPAWAIALEARLDSTCAIIARDPRRVFSHKDLNPMNMLWDGQRIWLIDWESAGLAHPYLDLATLANLINLADGDALGLLAAQERATIDPGQQDTFAAMRDLSRITYGAVFMRLIPDLTAIAFASRGETPTLGECYARFAAGSLSPSAASGQALLGAALFKQCA
jgi:aminoglycoside phosphotransferase (APT) family kinase protein